MLAANKWLAASSWLTLVFGPFKSSKLVIPHSKCDLMSFLLFYRWKNTQFVRRCDSQSTSSGVYFPTWLRSVNKEADTPSVSETGLTRGAPPSRHGFRGLVIPHYSNGLRSQTPRGCSHRSKRFPPIQFLVHQVNTEDSGSTGVWHRRLPQFVGVTAAVRGGLLPADGALKKIWPVGLGGGGDH